MLGVVHRSALGLGPPQLHRLFRPAPPSSLLRAPYRHRLHREESCFPIARFFAALRSRSDPGLQSTARRRGGFY
eukprot:8866203-Pyramimonas_sp.AAC.1